MSVLSRVVPYLLLVSLAVHVGAHVAIAVALARSVDYGPKRGALAFFIPPLAPYWAWKSGMKRAVWTWLGALGAYALGVALG